MNNGALVSVKVNKPLLEVMMGGNGIQTMTGTGWSSTGLEQIVGRRRPVKGHVGGVALTLVMAGNGARQKP